MEQGDLSKIESGRKDPRLSTLNRIAAALDAQILLIPKEQARNVERLLAADRGPVEPAPYDLLEAFGVDDGAP